MGSPGFFCENEPVQRLLRITFAADAIFVDRAGFCLRRAVAGFDLSP
jgi:hypothetical protein